MSCRKFGNSVFEVITETGGRKDILFSRIMMRSLSLTKSLPNNAIQENAQDISKKVQNIADGDQEPIPRRGPIA